MQMLIKVRDLKHSPLNVAIRDKDTPQVKDKDGKLNPNPALAAQQKEFTADILRGMDLLHTPGTIDGQRNPALGWLVNSTFIVELVNGKYEALSGRHRLDWLVGNVDQILHAAKAAKEESEVKRLKALAETWLDFPVLCDVRTPKDDDDRREIVAEGNPDDNRKSRIEQSVPSKFEAFYRKFPTPSFLCHWTKEKEPTADFDTPQNGTWTNATFQSVTGIRGNSHTTMFALMALGKHFDLPVSFFLRGNRLKIKPQVTQAILIKTTPEGEGSAVVKEFGLGFVTRYKQARASCAGSATESLAGALLRVKDEYKREFIEKIMDGDERELDADYVTDEKEGLTALGNVPEKDDAQKEADAKAKAAEKQEASDALAAKSAANQPFKFAQDAVGRALNVPNTPQIAAHVGTLFDLLLNLSASRFEACAKSLAMWKEAQVKSLPSADTLAETALAEVADVLTAYTLDFPTRESEVVPKAEAASATANTPKAKKHKVTK